MSRMLYSRYRPERCGVTSPAGRTAAKSAGAARTVGLRSRSRMPGSLIHAHRLRYCSMASRASALRSRHLHVDRGEQVTLRAVLARGASRGCGKYAHCWCPAAVSKSWCRRGQGHLHLPTEATSSKFTGTGPARCRPCANMGRATCTVMNRSPLYRHAHRGTLCHAGGPSGRPSPRRDARALTSVLEAARPEP